jgi:molybdate transport system substrate-binding protein
VPVPPSIDRLTIREDDVRTLRSLLIAITLALAVSPQSLAAESITVAAAADLNYALPELAAAFEKATGTKVVISFGASGNLFSQIQNGAPFDLFFSADEDYPKKLAAANSVDGATLRTYAIGHVVLWVPANSPFDPVKLQINLLTQPQVTKVAIANPQHAPYGRAAMAAIEHFGLQDKIASKLVFGENVSQAAQFAQSGNAQAALIAQSLAKSPAMSSGKYWELPTDAYPELRQAAVVVSASKHKKEAQAFLDFVLSPEGARVLRKFGLTPARKP